jgi:hypothetical protein
MSKPVSAGAQTTGYQINKESAILDDWEYLAQMLPV